MWHDVLIMNRLSRWLTLGAVLLLGASGVHWLAGHPSFAIRTLDVRAQSGAALDHVTVQQLGALVVPRLSGTFFTADLSDARRSFEAVPWVRRASVRRQWPDRLVVRLEEHQALARWNDEAGNRFVNVQGEAFNAPGESALGKTLPLLLGPEGREAEVARRYAEFDERLKSLGKRIDLVALSARDAWTLKFAGLTLEIGREQARTSVLGRVERFAAHYAVTVGKLSSRVDVVDLRYPNGFAVRVPGLRSASLAAPSAPKPERARAPQRNAGKKPQGRRT
jgi:cell division protein FtsQ